MTHFERPTPDEGERVIRIYKNNAANSETIPLGAAVVHDYSAGNFGLVTKPATALRSLFAGIALAPVVGGAYGRFLVSGPVQALVLNNIAQAIAVGDLLLPINGQWFLQRSGAADGLSGLVLAAQDYAISNPTVQALKWVHVRAS